MKREIKLSPFPGDMLSLLCVCVCVFIGTVQNMQLILMCIHHDNATAWMPN